MTDVPPPGVILDEDIVELRAQIRQTRDALGATAETLAKRADVKAQVQQKVEHVWADQRHKAIVAACVFAGAMVLLVARRHARRLENSAGM